MRPRPRIGIDARFGRSPGVDRYAAELVRHLARLDGRAEEYVVYGPRASASAPGRDNGVERAVIPVGGLHPAEQPWLAWRLRRDRLDLYHATNYWSFPLASPCAVVSTAHDVCAFTHPELVRPRARLYARLVLPHALARSRRILTVSEYSREQIARRFPWAASRVVVAPNGVDARFRPAPPGEVEAVRRRYGLPRDYLLYVGSVRRNKRVDLLVRTYARLPRSVKEAHPLVLAGRRTPGDRAFHRELDRACAGEPVIRPGAVADQDLPALYTGAVLLVSASGHEGFGLPLLEAMACGTPVVAVRTAAAQETCRGAAAWVEPDRLDDLAAVLAGLLADPERRAAMGRAGRERSRRYSWEETARRVRHVYREVLAEVRR